MDAVLEYEQLIEPRPGQAGNHRDAVADLDDMADLFESRLERQSADALAACGSSRADRQRALP